MAGWGIVLGALRLASGCGSPAPAADAAARAEARADVSATSKLAAADDTDRCKCPDADRDGYPGAPCESDCAAASAGVDCDDDAVATFPGAVEDLDYADNDCDGARDEDYLLLLYRLNWTNGRNCDQAGADFDHLFSLSPEDGAYSVGGFGGGPGWLQDGRTITIYSPGIGSGDEATVGGVTFAALLECYNADTTEHMYLPAGHPLLASEGFECTRIGYVYTGTAPDTTMRAVRYHECSDISTKMWSILKDEAELECNCQDRGSMFWGFAVNPDDYIEGVDYE